jgi:hypothetical protein
MAIESGSAHSHWKPRGLCPQSGQATVSKSRRSVDDMSLEPNDYAFISAWDAAQGIYHVRVRAVVAVLTSGSSGEIAVIMP